MAFPVAIGDGLGSDWVIDIGLGNRNENAFAVVFPEPMSSVDALLAALIREPASSAHVAVRGFVLRTRGDDLRRLPPRDLILGPARSAFIQHQLVLGRRPRLPGEYRLRFDGQSLEMMQGDRLFRRWAAMSGKVGYQGAEHQQTEDVGPLPEGEWVARQSRFQRIGPYGRVLGIVGIGTWPGATGSWGRFRVWLDPLQGTRTYGRSGFSIHGGRAFGSAGCIDLAGAIEDFTRYFLAYGRDMTVSVEYPPAGKSARSAPR